MAGYSSFETLERLLARELNEPAANTLRMHLRGCARCQSLLLVRIMAGLCTPLVRRTETDSPAMTVSYQG
jgi:hypothetical protein